MEYKLHKTFSLRGNILHLVKKVIKLDTSMKDYFLVPLEHRRRMARGVGEGRACSHSGLASTHECAVRATTGTKGSASASGRDSEGVME